MKTFPRNLLALAGLAALALALIALAPQPSSADEDMSMREFFRVMDAKYAPLVTASPEQTRGTGFKPYQRFKYFYERRLGDDQENMVPGSRWEAWKQLRQIEQERGTRSETWFSLGPINVAGRCLAIEIDPTNTSIAYAGFASSGIWKTTDSGLTWVPLDDFLPTLSVGAIELDTSNPNRIWIGTGEGWNNIDAVHGVGVLVSTDAGATWGPTGYTYPASNGRDVFELEYNPATGTLIVGADNGLWRSTDQGTTFTQLYNSGTWTDVELKQGSSNIMFASSHSWTDFGFYRSMDDGATWFRMTNGTPTANVANNRFALTAADPEYIYWAISRSGGQSLGIYRSTDGGDSWSVVNTNNMYGQQGWYDLTIDASPTNRDVVFSGGVDFFRSTNGATSFVEIAQNVHVDHHAIAWAPSDPNHLWLGSDGGVWQSTNGGSSFTDRNAGLTTLQFYAMNHGDSMPTRALGGTQDNGTYLYNNSLSWAHILGGDGFFTEVDRLNPLYVYSELYYGDHRRSSTGGPNMIVRNTGIDEQGPWSTPTHMDYVNPSVIYTAHNTKIFKTTNRMDNWSWTGNPSLVGGGVSIHSCRTQPNYVVVISPSKVWLSSDAGATWVDRTSGQATASTLSDVHMHPTDPNIILLTLASYNITRPTVRKTTDMGLTWFDSDAGLPNEPANTIEIDPQHPDYYFVGTDLATYVSFNAGLSWSPFNTGLPHVVVADLRIHDTARVLRAGTHGRGMWEVDISNINPTAVDDVKPTVQPLTLRVLGNPAVDQTLLRYGIRTAGQVRLDLYDAQGRLVRNLFDRFEYPIMGSVELDLRDLPGGVYFARLQSNGAEATQKLVVQR